MKHLTAVICAIVHLILFAIHLFLFYSWGIENGQLLPNADLIFLPIMILDFPIYVIFAKQFATEVIFSQSITTSVISYCTTLGLLGTAYWYGLGILAEKVYKKFILKHH